MNVEIFGKPNNRTELRFLPKTETGTESVLKTECVSVFRNRGKNQKFAFAARFDIVSFKILLKFMMILN